MDELWLRVGLVAAATAVTALAAYVLSTRSGRRPRTIRTGALAPGVYLLTSATCPDCAPARDKLGEALGEDGYVEVTWEDRPDVLQELGVDAVPATLIVDEEGRGVLYPGQPDQALARLGP